MDNIATAKQLVEGLKNATVHEINTFLVPLTEVFPLLSGNDKLDIAENFYKWVSDNAELQPYKKPIAIYILGVADFFTEKYEQCLEILPTAVKLFEEQNNPDGKAMCDLLIAAIYRTFGDTDLALKGLWDSYSQLSKSGIFTHYIMAAAYQIAGIYVEKKNYDEAEPLYKNTLSLAEKLSNKLFVINAKQGLGKVYMARQEYAGAKEAFESALIKAKETGSLMFISNIETELANYYYETGNYNESIRHHVEALKGREQQKLTGASITNTLQLADIYDKLNQPEQAITILHKALELAIEIKIKPKIYQLHRLLAQIYEHQNDLIKSLYHYKCFHDIQQEVEAEDAVKKIKNLQMVFEAEQTKKENIIIKKQKVEIEQKNRDLQETIDELTRTKVSKRAKALTLIVAMVLFVAEDFLLEFVLHRLPEDNFILTLSAKLLIVFSLKPIEGGIEHYMLKRVMRHKKTTMVLPNQV